MPSLDQSGQMDFEFLLQKSKMPSLDQSGQMDFEFLLQKSKITLVGPKWPNGFLLQKSKMPSLDRSGQMDFEFLLQKSKMPSLDQSGQMVLNFCCRNPRCPSLNECTKAAISSFSVMKCPNQDDEIQFTSFLICKKQDCTELYCTLFTVFLRLLICCFLMSRIPE